MILTQKQKDAFSHEGYVVARGLLPPDLVKETRDKLYAVLGLDPARPDTWPQKTIVPHQAEAIDATTPARTADFEAAAAQLVGTDFLRGVCYSPFLHSRSEPDMCGGYIPVVNCPTPGPQRFERPGGYHIDGGDKEVTLWPERYFLAVMAYLTDVSAYGGATVVRPGSHRQVLAHFLAQPDAPFSTRPPDLDYAEPVPITAQAGDVCFMHYLLVHSGSANHADRIRVGMNTAVMPDPARPYVRKPGPPAPDWTPMDHALRTDNLPAACEENR